MPRKPSVKNVTPEQMLKKIRKAAQLAAYKGQICLSKEKLIAEKGYTDKQADIYMVSFREKAGTPEEQEIRKAREAGRNTALQGQACPSVEQLKMKYNDTQIKAYVEKYKECEGDSAKLALRKAERAARDAVACGRAAHSEDYLKSKMQYTAEQVKAYLEKYQSLKGNTEEQGLKKANRAAQQAASQGNPCQTKETLKSKGYTDKEVEVYLAVYDRLKGTDEEQAMRKVQKAARKAALRGQTCPSIEQLKSKKKYNDAQIEAYVAKHKAFERSAEIQEIRKVQQAASNAVNKGQACPSMEHLKNKMKYNDEQVKAYLEKFHELKGDAEEQGLKKARQAAQVAVSRGCRCFTKEELNRKGYTEKEAETYFAAYQTAKGSDESLALKKAREDGRQAACHRRGYPTEKTLKDKGYTDDQIKSYQEGYKTCIDNKEKKEAALDAQRLQQFLAENSDIGFDLDNFLSISHPSEKGELFLTEQEKQSTTYSTEKNPANDNGLFFAFNNTGSSSLTDSNFLSLFQEADEKHHQETYSPF